MSRWPAIRDGGRLDDLFESRRSRDYWRYIFELVATNQINTWDYQLFFACFCQHGLTIAPAVNLISNIGMGGDATHTNAESPVANLPRMELEIPLRHPPFVIRDCQADKEMARMLFRKQSLVERATLYNKAVLKRVVGDRLYSRIKRIFRSARSRWIQSPS
jgi:hypothetical protein